MTTAKLLIALILTTLLINPAGAAENEKCVLPAPDYRPANTSKPSLNGIIFNIQPGILEIETSSSQKNHNKLVPHRIRINKETSIFTSFGGYVAQTELRGGEQVNVWYVGCDPKKAGSPPLAAVIEVIR